MADPLTKVPAASSKTLALTLLGYPTLAVGGVPVAKPLPIKALALLLYLAVEAIHHLALDTEGSTLLSACEFGTLLRWDMVGGRPIGSLLPACAMAPGAYFAGNSSIWVLRPPSGGFALCLRCGAQ